MMGAAFGLLGLSPATFWSMTLRELGAALRGRFGTAAVAGPPSRREVEGLMRRFPD